MIEFSRFMRNQILIVGILLGTATKITFGHVLIDKFFVLGTICFRISRIKSKGLSFAIKPEMSNFCALSFLILTIFHYITAPDLTKILWIGFFIILFLLLNIPNLSLSNLSHRSLITVMFVYTSFPIMVILIYKIYIFKFQGQVFRLENYFLSGSTIFCSVFIIFNYLIFEISKKKYKKQMSVLVSLMFFASYLLDSRLGKVVVMITMLAILLSINFEFRKKIYFAIPLLLTALLSPLIVDTFDNALRTDNAKSDTVRPWWGLNDSNSKGGDILLQAFDMTGVTSAIDFYVNPRESDEDRRTHLICAFETHQKLDPLLRMFGAGPQSHRTLLTKCFLNHENRKESYTETSNRKGSRSTTVSFFLIDYGIFGTLLILLCACSKLLSALKRRKWPEMFSIIGFFLVGYLGDFSSILLFWLVLIHRDFLKMDSD